MKKEWKEQEVIKLTQKLIQIPTENPPGNEKYCMEFVYNWYKSHEISMRIIEVEKGRSNIISTLKGRDKNIPLVILAHMDTVPANKNNPNSFSGKIVNNRIYGRGAADMKGGLAVAMMAIKNIKESSMQLKGDLVVAATVDEEGKNMLGAQALINKGIVSKDTYIIATEPTELSLRISHKGVLWYGIETFGKSCHAGEPQFGADAIHGMSLILEELKEYVATLPYNHKHLGKPTLNIGKIWGGGDKTNVVPDYCRAEIDFRIVPPMTITQADGIVQMISENQVKKIDGIYVKIEKLGLNRKPVVADEKTILVESIKSAYKEEMGTELLVKGFTGYTEAGIIAALNGNKNCVVFGPGELTEAHSMNESVPIEHLIYAEKILTKIILKILGKNNK